MTEPAERKSRLRGERLEARVTAEEKRLVERAAALRGRTVTDFVLTSVQEAACAWRCRSATARLSSRR